MRTSTCALLCLFFASLSPLHGQQSTAAEGAQKEPGTQSSDAASTARDEKELIQLEKDFAAATLKGDHDFYNRVLADDWVNIHEDGSVGTKQGDAAHKSEYDTVTFDDIKVRVYGDSAVAVGRYSVGWTEGGRHSAVSGRFTDVWLRRNGRWQIVSTQNTPVPQAKPDAFPSDSFFIDKEEEVWEALKKKDKAADSRLLADDFVGLYDTGFAAKFDHVNQMDDKYSIDSYNVQDAKVLRLSPTMALLLYKATCNGSGEWEQYCSRPDFVSSLWVERDGHWVNLFSQDTQATGGESDDAVLNAIVANEQKIFETLKRNDITAFGNMLPEDVIMVEDDGIHTKAVWLKEFEEQKKTGLLFTDFKMEDLRVVRYSPSAATLVFRETIDGMQNGRPFEWHFNSSSGYVNRNGKWVPVLYQDSVAK